MGNCPACSIEESNKNLDPQCFGKRMWITFIFSSFILFISGFIIILISTLIRKLLYKYNQKRLSTINSIEDEFFEYDQSNINWITKIKEWENNIISGKTILGKTFVCRFKIN